MKKYHPLLRFLINIDTITMRKNAFLQRRPHRSFRRTRRRDYVRSLKLPGYWSFTNQVAGFLWHYKRIFFLLALLYGAGSLILGGITNQATYQQISDMLNQSVGEIAQGTWGTVWKAGTLLAVTFLSPSGLTPEQQIYLGLALIIVWLTATWLLRDIMAGGHPKLRDGLYNACAPLISTFVLIFIALLQLIPVAVAALVYTGLTTAGILTEGVGMMLFSGFAILVITLVLYWMTPTFLALVIVTLPGMYPMRAMKAAGDIVVGRRLRILYRILWLILITVLGWAIIMIPLVILDTWLKNIVPGLKSVPFIPIMVALLGSLTAVWCSSYVYMLYRRIVDDDASPA